ncbi:MAG: DUF4388 domain-containing protein [Deinococcales bacterium]
MFKVALSITPTLVGTFQDWTLLELLNSLCKSNLTAVICFTPSNIELLIDKGHLLAARGAIKLSQILVQEGVVTKHQLQGAEQLAPTLLEALDKLGVEDVVIRRALRTQLIVSLKLLLGSKPSGFSVFSAMTPPASFSPSLSLAQALGEVKLLQKAENAILLSHATIERLIDQAPFEIEMNF